MGKKKFNKEDDRYQKMFNENKELKRELSIAKNQIERSKKPCSCERPPKKEKAKEPDLIVEKSEICEKCGLEMAVVEYSKIGESWFFLRCPAKHRTHGKKMP